MEDRFYSRKDKSMVPPTKRRSAADALNDKERYEQQQQEERDALVRKYSTPRDGSYDDDDVREQD